MDYTTRRVGWRSACCIALLASTILSSAAHAQSKDPLLDVLVRKGVIGKTEAEHIAASPPDQQRSLLTQLLESKGVLSAQDVKGMGAEPASTLAPAPVASVPLAQPVAGSATQTGLAAQPGSTPTAPSRVAAQRTRLPDRSAAANPIQTANDAPYTDVEKRESPLSFRIGNAEFTPGGFIDFDTIFRTTNTGNLGTNFFSIPFSNTIQGHNSEVKLTAQASELNLKMQDRLGSNDITAFVSMDFLGNDAANDFVTSNSHTARLREGWADVRHGDWELLAGQVWGLQTPNRYGLNTYDASIFTTYNEDFNYQVGLPWTRAAAIRGIYHPNDNWAFALEVQNPDQFGGQGEITFPTAFNAQLASQIDQANQSTVPNLLPDFIFKGSYDSNPGGPWNFHVEAGGLLSVFRITDLPDILDSTFVHHTAVGGGGFAAVNAAVATNFTIVANALGGPGVGRYLFGLGPDLVALPNAAGDDVFLSTVKAVGGIGGLEFKPVDGTVLAAYYGGTYFGRDFAMDNTLGARPNTFIGFGGPNSANSNNRAIQEASLDWVQNWWQNQQYGTVQTTLQGSYVTRSPWFVAAGAPKDAHLFMTWFSLKYILPP
jgi:hypothetical protein